MQKTCIVSIAAALLLAHCQSASEDELTGVRHHAAFAEWRADELYLALFRTETYARAETGDIFTTPTYTLTTLTGALRLSPAAQRATAIDTARMDTVALARRVRVWSPDSSWYVFKEFGALHRASGEPLMDIEYLRLFSASGDTLLDMALESEDSLGLYRRWR
jgi:hypothetical protein